MKKILIILTAIAIFLVSLLRIIPVEYKGYSPSAMHENLILARNLALHNVYKIESDKNVILSSMRIEKEGVPSSLGNKLTPILYAQLYKIFGLNEKIPVYTSILFFALFNVVLFFVVLRLFSVQGGFLPVRQAGAAGGSAQGAAPASGQGPVSGGGYWPGIIFSLFSIFMPVIWLGSVMPGFYEFAIFFFSFGLLVYFCVPRGPREVFFETIDERTGMARPVRQSADRAGMIESLERRQRAGLSARFQKTLPWALLFFSGIFLGLAVLSRNAFLFSVLPLFFYDFFKTRSFKRLVVLVLPFLIVVGGFFASDILKGQVNSYLSKKPESFTTYGHLFPDPYTYHFNRENYLKDIKDISDPDISQFALQYGYKIGFGNRLLMYLNSLIFYPKKLFATTVFGGPIFVFLMILGGICLYQRRKDLFQYFFGFWLPFWYIMLVISKTNNWDHFLEVSFPLVLIMSLGACWLIEYSTGLFSAKQRILFSVGLVLFVFLQIFSANKWMFHEAYESSSLTQYPKSLEGAKQVILTDRDIVAVGIHPSTPELLNYYTDKNYIYFAPQTIEKLMTENKIVQAFRAFGATRFLGYDPELSKLITQQTGLEEIK